MVPYVFAFYNQAWANNSWSAKITSTAVSEEPTQNQNQFYGLNDGQLVECRYIAINRGTFSYKSTGVVPV